MTTPMRHYTATVPPTLAEKLKEKGMPIKIELEWYPNGMAKAEKDCHKPMTKYCEVFDWLLNKEIFVNAYPERIAVAYGEYIYMYRPFVNGWIGKESDRTTWHEAANAVIEKALTLI